ncbi:putative tuberous sclerosis 1 protein [Botrytis fragariae]|uniref:Putative tuberous sclerosis 1 protein n=1 Tax=Botrytis fragariae TaxID=1964551 RepID=A0A8H6ASI2_9HELO|nr:putative tuberous sclerosis 1 protein [Botrytis fragariae]KAF5872812.1 putative tuberous sclerosis 1 protein [Botrytis fragariae]
MSSGSLKDLTKAIKTSVTTSTRLPLPDDLVRIIHTYLEKNPTHDESDASKIQEELLSIYEKDICDHPTRYAPFLSILRKLRTSIKGGGRMLQWWDKLCIPVLSHLGEEKGLALEARNTLLDILIYDEDEEHVEDAITTSDTVAENLIAIWLAKCNSVATNLDENSKFIESQLRSILISFGRKRPKNFLTAINQFFVKKDSRILALSLLCEFIRHQPPHLHQLLQTPLFENLLRCLQIDTSTRVVSLAMTALIMFLPHIPSSLSKHLPALFNIYSRMLFWDRERKYEDNSASDDQDDRSTHSTSSWTKLSYLLDSEDVSVPELLHYYTFLYGLYPMNFMSYIRKPQKFLRHQGFPGANEFAVEPMEIRQRSEPFRQLHLLHPNFFTMTIDQELSDTNRWMKSEASDVVTECMALYIPGYAQQAPLSRSQLPNLHIDTNADVPDQPLTEHNAFTPAQSRHTSWRFAGPPTIASPEALRNSVLRRASFTSQSMPSIADSPILRPERRLDSPTLPPVMATSPSHTQLQDMLDSQRAGSIRGGIYQTLTNDSVQSLALSHHAQDNTSHVDSYLQSLTRAHALRSPSLRPGTNDSTKVAYLQRDIMLLKNDLNFERYLKQQHLTHIGQLRRKAIREARVEAETQNLINSNKILRAKLEDAKKAMVQMKKEFDKSRNHSRKWESDLTAKLRLLKEEQKKWIVEGDQLKRELSASKIDIHNLRQLVVQAEYKVSHATQEIQVVESNKEELERLRIEAEKLTTKLRRYEALEVEMDQAKQDEEQAYNTIEILNMKLKAKDAEIQQLIVKCQKEVQEAQNTNQTGFKQFDPAKQKVIDEALAGSRRRMDDMKKAHSNLLKRYTKLQQDHLEALTAQDRVSDLPMSIDGSPGPHIPPRDHRRLTHSYSDSTRPGSLVPKATFPLTGTSSFIARPRIDSHSPTSGHAFRSTPTSTPTSPDFYGGRFSHSSNFGPAPGSSHSDGTISRDGNNSDRDSLEAQAKPKVKPQSEMRGYGRGGVGNIGAVKKDKDNGKDRDKGRKEGSGSGAEESPKSSPKEKKKGSGLRGLRAFV